MPHGATHPCRWCDAKKGSFQFEGNTRTFQGLQDHFWNYVDAGREKKQAKLFDNVIHPSIVTPNDLEKSVLDVIPPPELHLFLGPVNTIYNALTEKWKGSSEWLKRCHVERERHFLEVHLQGIPARSFSTMLTSYVQCVQSIVCHTLMLFRAFLRLVISLSRFFV